EVAPLTWPWRAETPPLRDRLERDQDNLRAALGWYRASAADVEAALRLAVALHGFWLWRGRGSEGREVLASLLPRVGEVPTALRAQALALAGDLAALAGDRAEARPLLEEALALFRELADAAGVRWMLNALGWAAYGAGDFAAARGFFEELGPGNDFD